MNPGTEGGGLVTKVGNDCLFMASAHVAHDCTVGNDVILANNATLAGHVSVGDGAIIGGLSAVHQFVRIGAYAFIGGMSGVEKDVIPYGTVKGERASLDGLNLIGLKRRNVERDHIHALRRLFKELFLGNEGTLAERAQKLQSGYDQPEGARPARFRAERHLARLLHPRRRRPRGRVSRALAQPAQSGVLGIVAGLGASFRAPS